VTRNVIAAVHSSYWGMYLLLVSLFLLMVRAPHAREKPLAGLVLAWPLLLIALAPSVAGFYASYGPLFSRFLARRRFGAMLAGGLGVSLGASAIGLALALVFFGRRQPAFSRIGEFAALTLTLAAIAAIHVAVAPVVRGFVGWWQHGAGTGEPPLGNADVDTAPAPSVVRDVIFVKTEQRLEKIRLDEILLIEGQRDYRRIHTTTRRIMTLQTFADFERQLPPEIVCRVHKSYMVAVGKIDCIERGRIAINNLSVPISETYRERFFALIGQR
jgi:hypothetical protein